MDRLSSGDPSYKFEKRYAVKQRSEKIVVNSNPKCEWLLLIPTPFELKLTTPFITKAVTAGNIVVETCGFGPVAAAASTAHFIAKHQPNKIMLLGIAGAYSDELEIGNAYQFGSVSSYGIGVGNGTSFQSADQLGWKQLTNGPLEIGDKLEIDEEQTLSLLTVCAASNDVAEVQRKRSVFPNAAAEDMEGFGVAMASRIAGYDRVTIIRGISNQAGDRNKENWQIKTPLESACQIALPLLGDA